MQAPTERLTDLQYGIVCGLTIDTLAARISTGPNRVREELADAPVPDWAAPLIRAALQDNE